MKQQDQYRQMIHTLLEEMPQYQYPVFPYMFPPQRAAEIAVATVQEWLEETGSGMNVVFNVFKDTDREIYDRLLNPATVTKR